METGTSIQTRNRTMTGLRFLFRVTMRRLDLANEIHHIKEPTRIPQILSAEEAARLLAMANNLQTRVLLSIGYGTGLRVSEVVRLKVKHIDSSLGIIRVGRELALDAPQRRRGREEILRALRGRERRGRDCVSMAPQDGDLGPGARIPQTRRVVVRARHHACPIRAEGDKLDRSGVASQRALGAAFERRARRWRPQFRYDFEVDILSQKRAGRR